MGEIKYEVKEVITTLSENAKGWKKQLALVSWNNAEPKFDIRTWDQSHTKMGKGVTLSESELKELYLSLQRYFGENKDKEEGSSKIEQKNVGLLIENLATKAPLFFQELKNIVAFIEENNYISSQKRELFLNKQLPGAPISLINEIESLSTIYYPFYKEFVEIIEDLNDSQLEKVIANF